MTDASSLTPLDPDAAAPAGTQTLMRGLAVVQAVADGARDLKELCARIGVARSTTHRLASCLVQERYLRVLPGVGYALGPKLIELGFQAREAFPLATLARPYLDGLAELTGDTIHLAVRDNDEVLYLEKIPGKKGLEMRSRVGHRMPLATGVGKALLLDADEPQWKALHRVGGPVSSRARRAAGLGGVPRTHARLCGAGLCLRPGRQRAVDPLRGGAGARRLQRHRGRHQRVQHRALYVAGAHGRDGAGGV